MWVYDAVLIRPGKSSKKIVHHHRSTAELIKVTVRTTAVHPNNQAGSSLSLSVNSGKHSTTRYIHPSMTHQPAAPDSNLNPARTPRILIIFPRQSLGRSIPHPTQPRRGSARLSGRARNRRLQRALHTLPPNNAASKLKRQTRRRLSDANNLHGLHRTTEQPAIPAGPGAAGPRGRGEGY